jgi:hypothetical protein
MTYVELQSDGLLTETRDAVLLAFGDQEVWLPKSCIENYDDDYKWLTITEHIAVQKEIDCYII